MQHRLASFLDSTVRVDTTILTKRKAASALAFDPFFPVASRSRVDDRREERDCAISLSLDVSMAPSASFDFLAVFLAGVGALRFLPIGSFFSSRSFRFDSRSACLISCSALRCSKRSARIASRSISGNESRYLRSDASLISWL